MRWKITIILILLNIATFYGLFFLQKQSENKNLDNKNTLANHIIDIDKIDIINKNSKESRTLERQNGQWKITSPIEWPANLFAIQRIITQLQFLIYEAKFSIDEIQKTGQSLDDFGLKNPNILLKFKGLNGEHTLAIGNPTPLGNRVYVMDPDQKNILVIKDSLLDSIAANLEELRTQQIFNIPFYELDKLKIQLLSPHNIKIGLSKEDNSWNFDTPIQTSANATLVNNAINQLTSINTERILLNDEADHAHILLRTPFMKITLEGHNQKQTLILAKPNIPNSPNNEYYAQLENNTTLFTVPTKPFDNLHNAQEALREKQLLSINTENLKNISISQSHKKIELQKLENNQWQLINKDPSGNLTTTEADDKELQKIQNRLSTLEIITFISDAPSTSDLQNFGFNDPQRIIELHADKKQTLLIGGLDPSSGNLYAKLEDSPYIYSINPNILSWIPINDLHYKLRLIDKLPKGALITSLKITHLSPQEETFFEQTINPETTTWESTLANLEINRKTAILNILNNLKEFKVKNFLKNHFEQTVNLDNDTQIPWAYKIQAEALLPGGENSKTITLEYYFTKRLSGALQIGGSNQKNIVFSAEQNWIDNLFIFHTPEQIPQQIVQQQTHPADLPDL